MLREPFKFLWAKTLSLEWLQVDMSCRSSQVLSTLSVSVINWAQHGREAMRHAGLSAAAATCRNGGCPPSRCLKIQIFIGRQGVKRTN